VRLVRFLLLFDADVRLRHAHRTERGRVVSFVVQLELHIGGRWRPVVRYDSAHGDAHRHLFRPGRRSSRESLAMSMADGLTYAESDIRSCWAQYVGNFRRRLKG